MTLWNRKQSKSGTCLLERVSLIDLASDTEGDDLDIFCVQLLLFASHFNSTIGVAIGNQQDYFLSIFSVTMTSFEALSSSDLKGQTSMSHAFLQPEKLRKESLSNFLIFKKQLWESCIPFLWYSLLINSKKKNYKIVYMLLFCATFKSNIWWCYVVHLIRSYCFQKQL